MVIDRFETLLKQAMGLDAASIGSLAVERAVQERLSARKLPNLRTYWALLSGSDTELQALIEAVVVPETWFFRDPASFAALARLVSDASLPAQARANPRLLSVPCSTGEEPYSMAMALLDAGLPASALHIDAVDISTRALARAEKALYGRNSFRGGDLAFRDRHFTAVAGGHRPAEAVRRSVRFRQGNLLGGLPGAKLYDAIFCRNVLIYFDRATQSRAVGVLGSLLAPHGWLFVGPSETALLSDHGFVSARLPLAFAFRKGPSTSPDVDARPRVAATPKTPVRALASAMAVPLGTRPAPTLLAIAPPSEAAAGLDRARRLADEGLLAAAAAHCEVHLGEHGASAEAFYLLGLVRDASGNANDAANQYRKVLYLEPNHHGALIHLALLLQRQGDAAASQRLQQRANRLQQTSGA